MKRCRVSIIVNPKVKNGFALTDVGAVLKLSVTVNAASDVFDMIDKIKNLVNFKLLTFEYNWVGAHRELCKAEIVHYFETSRDPLPNSASPADEPSPPERPELWKLLLSEQVKWLAKSDTAERLELPSELSIEETKNIHRAKLSNLRKIVIKHITEFGAAPKMVYGNKKQFAKIKNYIQSVTGIQNLTDSEISYIAKWVVKVHILTKDRW
jgi:hypothetical protein